MILCIFKKEKGEKMDPISHGIVGLGLYSLVHTPTLSSTACLGAIIGSISPDFDIIARIKGDYVYLNHHRVETHSIPGLGIIAGITAMAISLIYKESSFFEVFLWTFLGGLSHVILDYFNSYGVTLLYPFSKKKYSLNLLMIYDPILLFLSLYSILFTPRTVLAYSGMIGIFGLYILYRWMDKKRLKRKLIKNFGEVVKGIVLMPSDYNLMKWDYIIETHHYHIVGDISSITKTINIMKSLKKVGSPMIELSLKDELGMYFKNFTPYIHIDLIEDKEKFIVRMTDLRYRINNEFKHHASFYYNQERRLMKSVFHPFSEKNAIEIYSEKSVDAH